MNNQVRHDLYLSLLDKTHTSYHSQDTGEYISWLTTNVKQIERLAWEPFFSCVGNVALVVWCILALIGHGRATGAVGPQGLRRQSAHSAK